MIKYTKVDDFTLRETAPKIVEVEQEDATEKVEMDWDYSFLLKQKTAITEQRDEMIAQKEEELKRVEVLIAEAEKLGLKEKTEETELKA